VVKLYMAITKKEDEASHCYSIINKLLKIKENDNISFLQKCLMLMYIIRKYKDHIHETKYIGILINHYRELSYYDFKNAVFNDPVDTYEDPYKDYEVLN